MAEVGEENKANGVFSEVQFENKTENATGVFGGVEINNGGEAGALPAKQTFWSKFKAFWMQDITVELTPYQQKVEDEINEFLHQEITWEKVHDFLFQEITFGKKNK